MGPPMTKAACVLVVEDDERLLFALTEALGDAGYETSVAPDGHIAIQRLSAGFSPDVIVLDLEMPFVTGFEVANWLLQNDRRIPVVLATQEDDVEAKDVGAVVKLSKPFTLDELLAGVAAALERRPRTP